jgi:large subunit ribosomal protein L27
MGVDHTLYAVAPGYVRFYVEKRPQSRRKERRVVGIVLNKEERLPRDTSAEGRSRYFGFVNLNEQGALSDEASPNPSLSHR